MSIRQLLFLAVLVSACVAQEASHIFGFVQLENVPRTAVIDIGLYNKGGKIIRSTSASARTGYFDLYNVLPSPDGWTINVTALNSDGIDASSTLSVVVGPTATTEVLVKGLRLVGNPTASASEMYTAVPTLLEVLTSASLLDLPLIYQTGEGSFLGFGISLAILIALIVFKDTILGSVGSIGSFKPKKVQQQVSMVTRR
eukprot:GILI01036798.1.p1 GENE.GILI01036798.1~~GILI01036798.1.p1  ORF type:complete len:199 (-),score=21.06 GILI01036798.1:34-630(-)